LKGEGGGFLEDEKSFRRIQGHKNLWVLAITLRRNTIRIDLKMKTALFMHRLPSKSLTEFETLSSIVAISI